MFEIQDLFNLALTHHRKADLALAEPLYRRIIDERPEHADAHHLLGLLLHQRGNDDDALPLIRRAIALKPSAALYHFNLGRILRGLGKTEDAVPCYREALRLEPHYFDAANNLGVALRDLGENEQAAACLAQALAIDANHAGAHNNLGVILIDLGRTKEALAHLRAALRIEPENAGALDNLGTAFRSLGYMEDAAKCYQRAIQLQPDFAEAHIHLGIALSEQGDLSQAITSYQEALQIKPQSASAHVSLGNALAEEGRSTEAIALFRRALELDPNFPAAQHNLLYNLYFSPEVEGQAIYEEHRLWNERYARSLQNVSAPPKNDRSLNRPLRIGYLSPDFSAHPVGRFLLPLLRNHDRAHFEIICYSLVRVEDHFTEECRMHAKSWRQVLALSDEQIARLIRDDRVDILVDLTMHMDENRIMVFARKPAPVQVTYLAYCGTTGLQTIDYRLTDRYLDPSSGPPDRTARIPDYSEESFWLPHCYWCYEPLPEAGEVSPLPALETKQVTFVSLNNFRKVSDEAIMAWCCLLQILPDSRLLIHAKKGSHRERVWQTFADHQVARDRVVFLDKMSRADYFMVYQQADVALDSFPYAGGTTTCDALWLGVPVVTLAGKTAVGRAGVSILSTVAMSELIANNLDEYVRIAAELANDLSRLQETRAGLRERMQASPLMDARRFARDIEAAYREMWRRWCGS